MTGVHEEAAQATEDIIGAIWQRQLEIAKDAIEDDTGTDLDSTDEVKRKLHLFYDLDEIPEEFRELEALNDRLDAAYHALKGEDIAGDEQRFSTDIQPDEEAVMTYIERLEDIETGAVVAREERAIGRLEAALDDLLG
jgi:hypothetical protein